MERCKVEKDDWEYCQITYRTDYNFGGGEHAGLNLGLLWFVAETDGPNGSYEAGKSPEIPLARESDGFPDQHNPIHLSTHQQLIDTLVNVGWQPLSGQGSAWWQRRFKREPRQGERPFFHKMLDHFK